MTKLSFLLKALLIASTSSLLSAGHPEPGNWEVSAGVVFLRPSTDDTYFVIQSSSSFNAIGTRTNNDPGFHAGFSLGAAYQFCDCDRGIKLQYTSLRAKENKLVTGTNLWGTRGDEIFEGPFVAYTGSALSELKFNYDRFDALFVQDFLSCCGFDLAFVGGLEYASLDLYEKYTYQKTNPNNARLGILNESSKTAGIGPQLGFSVDYAFYESCDEECPEKLSFNLSSSGSLLVSKSKIANQSILDGGINYNVIDAPTWRIVPALHVRTGFQYEAQICCMETTFEVGYEFHSYIRGTARSLLIDSSSTGLTTTSYTNYDVHGPYLMASIRF